MRLLSLALFASIASVKVSCHVVPPKESHDAGFLKAQRNATDNLLFHKTMKEFLEEAKRHPDNLDWSTDGCSSAPNKSTLLDFDFLNACKRHDFGYRNYIAQHRNDKAGKTKIDEQFHKDMIKSCNEHKHPKFSVFTILGVHTCEGVAKFYFTVIESRASHPHYYGKPK